MSEELLIEAMAAARDRSDMSEPDPDCSAAADAIAALRRECDEAHEWLTRKQDDANAAYYNLLTSWEEYRQLLSEYKALAEAAEAIFHTERGGNG